MAKWHGMIGFVTHEETSPGDYEDIFVERHYRGDFIRNTRKLQNSGELNESINISNQISIVADPYATDNYFAMTYAEFRGAKWKVSDVDASQPRRLVLTLGGLWNG